MVKNNYMMKNRSIKTMILLLFCIIMITACGKTKAEKTDVDLFTGEWKCADHPLENESYYTGFLMMYIQEDGSFRMIDAEAGNPVISGRIEFLSDKELVLKCSIEDDFDPPPTWQSMNEEQEITYRITEDGELRMTYKEGEAAATLVFVKQ